MPWENIQKDPRFSQLTPEEQKTKVQNYFRVNFQQDPRWPELPEDQRELKRKNFFKGTGLFTDDDLDGSHWYDTAQKNLEGVFNVKGIVQGLKGLSLFPDTPLSGGSFEAPIKERAKGFNKQFDVVTGESAQPEPKIGRPFELSQTNLEGTYKEKTQRYVEGASTPTKLGIGLGRSVAATVDQFSSIQNLATLFSMGGFSKTASSIVAAIFAKDMAEGTLHNTIRAVKAWQEGDMEEVGAAAGEAVLLSLFAVGSAKHAVKGLGGNNKSTPTFNTTPLMEILRKEREQQAPEVVEGVYETLKQALLEADILNESQKVRLEAAAERVPGVRISKDYDINIPESSKEFAKSQVNALQLKQQLAAEEIVSKPKNYDNLNELNNWYTKLSQEEQAINKQHYLDEFNRIRKVEQDTFFETVEKGKIEEAAESSKRQQAIQAEIESISNPEKRPYEKSPEIINQPAPPIENYTKVQGMEPKPIIQEIDQPQPNIQLLNHLGQAIGESAKALFELVHPIDNALMSGIGFEVRYKEAIPHLKASWEHFKAMGHDVQQITNDIVGVYGNDVKPYLNQYMKENNLFVRPSVQPPTTQRQEQPVQQKQQPTDHNKVLGVDLEQGSYNKVTLQRAMDADLGMQSRPITITENKKGGFSVSGDAAAVMEAARRQGMSEYDAVVQYADGTLKEAGINLKDGKVRWVEDVNTPFLSDRLNREIDNKTGFNRSQDAASAKGWQYVHSPIHTALFRVKSPQGAALARANVDAGLTASHLINENMQRAEVMQQGLTKEQKLQVGKAAEDLLASKKFPADYINRMQSGDPIMKSAKQLVALFEDYRKRYAEHLTEMMAQRSPARIREAALEYSQNGGDIVEIADRHGVGKSDLPSLVEFRKDLDNAKKWGMNDYITKVELGTYRIVDGEGHVRAVEETLADARTRKHELLKDHPELTKLSITQDTPGKLNPLAERKGILRGEKNIFNALPAYIRKMEKKMAYDMAQLKMEQEFERDGGRIVYTEGMRKILRDQMDSMRNTPSYLSTFVDSMVEAAEQRTGKSFGKPGMTNTVINAARKTVANVKLGYRLALYAINLADGYGKTWSVVQTQVFRQALKFMKTKEWEKLKAEEEWSFGSDAFKEAGELFGTKLKGAAKVLDPLYAYSVAEPKVRTTAYAANYIYARQRMNLSDPAARKFAREGVRLQAGLYTIANMPKLFRSVEGKLVFQFKPFLTNHIEFIETMARRNPAALVRYLGVQMLLSGSRGTLLFMKSLPILGMLGVWDEIDNWLMKQKVKGVPVAGGITGAMNVDTAAPLTVQFPSTKPEDQFGPAIGEMIKFHNDITKPFFQGEVLMGDNVKTRAYETMTIARYWDKMFKTAMTDDGWVKDGQGKKLYKIGSKFDAFINFTGLGTMSEAEYKTADRLDKKETAIGIKNKSKIVDRVMSDIAKGKNPPEEMWDMCVAWGLIRQGFIMDNAKMNALKPGERAMLRADIMSKARKQEIYKGLE